MHYGESVTDRDRGLLGAELRRIREGQDLTGMEVAAALGWSQSKVSRMETGRFGASVGEVARLLDHYGVHEELRAGSGVRSSPRAAAARFAPCRRPARRCSSASLIVPFRPSSSRSLKSARS